MYTEIHEFNGKYNYFFLYSSNELVQEWNYDFLKEIYFFS
jgi:hypothetical protein